MFTSTGVEIEKVIVRFVKFEVLEEIAKAAEFESVPTDYWADYQFIIDNEFEDYLTDAQFEVLHSKQADYVVFREDI
jgi:hypothetical protein